MCTSIGGERANWRLLTHVLLLLILIHSEPAIADRFYDCDSDSNSCGGGYLNAFPVIIFSIIFSIWVLIMWVGNVLTKESRYWPFALIVGGSGCLIGYYANGVFGQFIAVLIIAVTWWIWELRTNSQSNLPFVKFQKEYEAKQLCKLDAKLSEPNSTAGDFQIQPLTIAEKLPRVGSTVRTPLFSDVPWAETPFQANKYRKLLSFGHTFAFNGSQVVATTPEGRRQLIYSFFDLDHLINIAEKNGTPSATSNAAPRPLTLAERNRNKKLAENLQGNKLVVIVIPQWDGGPWFARTFSARKAAFAFLESVPQFVVYQTGDQLLAAIGGSAESVADALYDAGIEPADSEYGQDKIAVVEKLTARMNENAGHELASSQTEKRK
jgi:hypothetical protein